MSAVPAELTIEVTAEDIANGMPMGNCDCPVALALKRLPGVTDVWVEFQFCTVTFNKPWPHGDNVSYDFPAGVETFIRSFDDKQPVEPFTFTASLDEEES